MTFYAIKDIRLGYYMPEIKRKRGYTWAETTKDCIPRLFKTKRAAQCALTWWLRGIAGGSYPNPPWTYGECEVTVTPVPHRSAGDMRIVKVSVHEVYNVPTMHDALGQCIHTCT